MSIATKRGDSGQTSLPGGIRVSKSTLRVEAYGTIDELNSALGFARSICEDKEVCDVIKTVQRELFAVGAAIAAPSGGKKRSPEITADMVEALTEHVHRIESRGDILSDWSLPGEHPVSAALDVARTICRRAERHVVRLAASEEVNPHILAYLNRLSDLLWLLGRLVESRAGVNAALRDAAHKGPRWSRAW